ncbi:MAG: cell division protein ZapA [Chromatiaceae bacterium]|jgi:cell division protein ZapA
MSEEQIPVTIRILDKEYRIACDPPEKEGLIESAHYLDQRMREIRQSGRVIGSDRIAVMAALNLTYELLQMRQQEGKGTHGAEHRLAGLQERVTEALAAHRELDAEGESV